RAHGRVARSTDPTRANYAFYSADAPGSGGDVWFSGYEAFALLIGIRLMGHGWPQGSAVSVMRLVRPKLETEHDRILRQDPKSLFNEVIIRQNAREGDMAFDNMDPVLLTIVSKPEASRNDQTKPYDCAICRGPQEAMKFALWASGGRGAWTMF